MEAPLSDPLPAPEIRLCASRKLRAAPSRQEVLGVNARRESALPGQDCLGLAKSGLPRPILGARIDVGPFKLGVVAMDKGAVFRKLHEAPGAFIIPNPWDIGTARLLASFGFKALATTSAGFAFSRGLPDGGVGFEAMIHHCREIAPATDLPVSADLERGKGNSPESAAETIFAAEAAGLAGCSIEDHTGEPDKPIYDFSHAVERVAAAVEAARALKRDFVFTARAENFLSGRPDIDDTIKRLQAFDRPAPMCSTRRASPISPPSSKSARRCQSRSMCWRSRISRSRRWPTPASGASRSARN